MTQIEHKLLWSSRYEAEHKLVLTECERVIELGGTFQISNVWDSNNWYSIIKINYPNQHE